MASPVFALALTLWLMLFGSTPCSQVDAAPPRQFSGDDLEFFEKEVRPLLVKRCYKCHSGESESLRGSLRLDSREAILKGGDTGAAAVSGVPEESLLIDAINYGDLYEMPPDSKMPAEEIAILTRWVRQGLPWPDETVSEGIKPSRTFDLQARRDSHWCWQPIRHVEPPQVDSRGWAQSPIDQFIWTRLASEQLQPAAPADKRTLIRRAYFDLVGLPPTTAEVEGFVQDESPEAFAKVVDRLLRSPHFGERWGRHWLDLVRYAESRGHEFDFDAPNAYQYRDYVIRAFNADLPYDEFIREQVAGDLLVEPRRHPEQGFNESVIGTGFWWLGEWVHSPVDIRKDETDRFDNMVDVFGKTFLAVTLGCARCHDHKFDAIAQSDYYAMFGYLQSSAYRQARFDTMQQNQELAEQLAQLDAHYLTRLASLQAELARPTVAHLPDYLQTAAEAMQQLKEPDWQKSTPDAVIFADFEDGSYGEWKTEGEAFGSQPVTSDTIASYQGKINAVGRYFVNTHNVRSPDGVRQGDQYTGTLTSPPFPIDHKFIDFWVGGGSHAGKTCVNLLINDRVVRSATGRNSNQMHLQRWDVSGLRGQKGRIQVVDRLESGWGNIGFDHVVFTNADEHEGTRNVELSPSGLAVVEKIADRRNVSHHLLVNWVEYLRDAAQDENEPFYLWSQLAGLAGADSQRRDAVWTRLKRVAERRSDLGPSGWKLPEGVERIIDYSRPDAEWVVDGPSFGTRPQLPGTLLASPTSQDEHADEEIEFQLSGVATYGAARRDATWNNLQLQEGTQKDSGNLDKWDRAGKTIRTPTFDITKQRVFALVRGSGVAFVVVDSHRMLKGPLHGGLLKPFSFATEDGFRWVEIDVKDYAGHNAHLEISAVDQKPLQVLLVVNADSQPNIRVDGADWSLGGALEASREGTDATAKFYQDQLVSALRLLESDPSQDVRARELGLVPVRWANWLLKNNSLLGSPSEDDATRENIRTLVRDYSRKRQNLERQLQTTSRTAMAMWDGTARNDHLLIRGNSKTQGEPVGRRFLLALGGSSPAGDVRGSGRLQLANAVADPENPLTSRVMVNRVWHHLFGRGIVGSTDNFGVLGEEPTHPELLDYLARRFTEDGWSVKQLIRSIMLSRTYRMSSRTNGEADRVDPDNKLLHRMRIRRLEGEGVRDSILALSGRLDSSLYGPSVPVHLTPFMQGRGRPSSGPLDGNGRRSIYVSVRRNFLSPMMLTFDTPQPFNTVGRRNVSNVPAQALILLNSSFIHEQAVLWAERVMKEDREATVEMRIDRLYREAFARPPRPDELRAAHEFLEQQATAYGLLNASHGLSDDESSLQRIAADVRVWSDLCHIFMNVKEFIYIQ